MKKIVFLLLLFSSLACGLLENVSQITPATTRAPYSTPSFVPSPAPCLVRTGIEDGGLLNLREGPGVNYAPVRVLHEGDVILLLGVPTHDDWQFVKADSIDGWANAHFIDCTLSTNASANLFKTSSSEVKR